MKITMLIILGVVILSIASTFIFLRQPIFGKAPNGKRLEQIQKSPNYRDGKFQNIHFTPDLTEGYSMAGITWDFLFKQYPRTKPKDAIPSVKTDLLNLSEENDVLVWFGHSSYFIQVQGKRFLIDPVFSGNAAPIAGSNKSFGGTDIYTASDMPNIDYLLITHDHYDHLDYRTILGLKDKVETIICGLGVGAHFEHWGFDTAKIIEKDWDQSETLTESLTLHTATSRHFSGRSFARNNTLWLSFILQTPNLNLYLGGDSGYDTHFAELGKKFGAFDLAILDNGQYNLAWQAIHMFPEEVLLATKELNAKRLFPVHSGKFKLAHHPWDEPLIKITELNNNEIPLVTPIVGEVVYLNDENQQFKHWWKEVN